MLTSGITPGVEDTGDGVSCLGGEGNLAVNGVKGNAKIDQVADAVRGFVGQDTHCLFITQAVAGGDSILEVKLGGIILSYGSSDTPLGVFGVAVVNTAFGYNQHPPLLLGQEGRIKPGNTTANYNVVIIAHHLTPPLEYFI
ncbi:hypothetical protein ES703_96855 [subsurface metagenome]